MTAAVRCAPPANRPTPDERDACLQWSVRELELLPAVRVILCLGAFAWNAAMRLSAAVALARASDGDGAAGAADDAAPRMSRVRVRIRSRG